MTPRILSLVALSVLSWSAPCQMDTLYFSEDGNANGLWTFDLMTGMGVNIGPTGTTSSTIGLAPSDQTSLLYGSVPWTLSHIQSDGSGFVDVGGATAEALAYVPPMSTLYACLNGNCFTMDPATGASTGVIATPPGDVEGLAFNGSDLIYAVVRSTSNLHFYDIATNTWQLVGDFGITTLDPGLAFNPGTGELYLKNTNDTNLYAIDPVTLMTRVIGNTTVNRGGGLAFVGPGIQPPTCTLTVAPGSYTGDVPMTLDSASPNGGTVDATFQFSTDGGAMWANCTPGSSSPIMTNPIMGLATGIQIFEWDSEIDGVGQSMIAVGVLVQAIIDDLVFPTPVICSSMPFDVDNTALCKNICGDCDENGVGPNILDALVAAQIAAQLATPTMTQVGCCDVDSNLSVNILDALLIAQEAAGLPVTLMCP